METIAKVSSNENESDSRIWNNWNHVIDFDGWKPIGGQRQSKGWTYSLMNIWCS